MNRFAFTNLALPMLLAGMLMSAPDAMSAERFSNGYAQPQNAFFRAGFWWSAENPGFGLDLHPADDGIVGIWATYDNDRRPVWYFGTASRTTSGEWRMPLTRFSGSLDAVPVGEPAGEISITFADGYAATMRWRLGQTTGTEEIAPLIATDQPAALDQTGFWYDPYAPGYGYSIATQGDVVLSVLYFYDANGNPRWAWADNVGLTENAALTLKRFTGTCPGCPDYDGALPSGVDAGTVKLSFLSETVGFADANLELASGTWQTGRRTIALLTDRPSGRHSDAQMVRLTNTDLVSTWFDSAKSPYPSPYDISVNFSPANPGAGQNTSRTNLLVQDVDELDVVKNDGAYLYALEQSNEDAPAIRILSLGDHASQIQAERRLQPDSESGRVTGLYLHEGPANNRQLITVAGDAPSYLDIGSWFAPMPWGQGKTYIQAYSLDSPTNPRAGTSIEFDGALLESRVVGNTLYTISRSQPDSESGTPLSERLPQLSVNDESQGPLVDAANILLPPLAPGYYFPDLITISAFDLADLTADPQSVTYLGLAEAVHVSANNVFLSSSRWGYSFSPVIRDVVPANFSSDIHRFSLQAGGISYAGSGTVEGFVGSGRLNAAFALSEDDGHLRVVSQGNWGELGQHRLSVLSLDSDQLSVAGFAPNRERPQPLGKPGEQLFGLRFVQDRLYAVTFKSIDPLYVVDLKDPADPFIAGELEIPGFSDYLHPVSDSLLLGFGKNAVDADGPGDGQFAWYQGLQVSLFDVSNPAAPALLRRLNFGRRGSQSSLLKDHRAFALLPANEDNTRPLRFTIPMVINDVKDSSEIVPDPSAWYDYRYSGLGMFEVIDPQGSPDLVWRDTMITHTAEDHPDRDTYSDATGPGARGIITDNAAIFYLRGEVFSSDWGIAPPVNGPF